MTAATAPRAYRTDRHSVSWWGMLGFCLTEITLFAALLASSLYLRGVAPALGDNGGTYPELALPLVMTALLVGSSLVLEWGLRALRKGRVGAWRAAMITTALLGVAFLLVQMREYARIELGADVNALRAVTLATTTLHGAHVAIGVLMNLFVQVRRKPSQPRSLLEAVENYALYWHVVDGVWIAILAVLYLSPRLW